MSGRRRRIAPGKKLTPGSSVPTTPPQTQEAAADFSNVLAAALRPLLEQMSTVNNKLDSMQNQLTHMEKRPKRQTKELRKLKQRLQILSKNWKKSKRKKNTDKNQLLQLQLERSMHVLRFQGMSEEKGEDLKTTLSGVIALISDLKQEALQSDMDLAYRTYPVFIRKNKLPGEIYVKFSKRTMRDNVLKAIAGKTLKVNEEEIKVLKVIPFEIWKRRHQYKDLIPFLRNQQIVYRWSFPEELVFKYKDKKIKIDSVQKAKNFLKEQLGADKDEDPNLEEGEEPSEEELDNTSNDSSSSASESEKGAAASILFLPLLFLLISDLLWITNI